jgi:hypothetical protein
MYAWYQNCACCYAYLDDFEGGFLGLYDPDCYETTMEQLKRCRWFTTGWTLQELLAPPIVSFFNSSWEALGNASSIEVSRILNEITSIPVSVFVSRSWDTYEYPIAQKMSWASGRETTRREDIAYCLLGLFDVYMPLLYGEGDKAFIRLQEEIIKRSDDRSIFTWSDKDGDGYCYRGLLARHPSEFSSCGDIRCSADSKAETESMPYTMTNHGLEMKTVLHKMSNLSSQHLVSLGVDAEEYSDCEKNSFYLLPLYCFRFDEILDQQVTILIMLRKWDHGRQQFARVQTYRLFEGQIHDAIELETIYVRQNIRPSIEWTNVNIYGIQLYFYERSIVSHLRGHSSNWKVVYESSSSGVLVLPQSKQLVCLCPTSPITTCHQLNKRQISFWFTAWRDSGDSTVSHPKISFIRRSSEESQPLASAIYGNQMVLGGKDEKNLSIEFCKTVLNNDRFVLQIGLIWDKKWIL